MPDPVADLIGDYRAFTEAAGHGDRPEPSAPMSRPLTAG